MTVATRQSIWSSAVLMLLALTCFSSIQAAEPPVLFGIGPITLDLERWDFTTRKSEGATIDTITEKRTGKRIIFVSLDANVVTNEDPLSVIPRLIRGPNDLTITEAPKVEQGAVAGGVLANYETMRLEKVAIVVRPKGLQATVFISTVNNPLEDPDLLEIKKLADSTGQR
jgi:hypothetical protein